MRTHEAYELECWHCGVTVEVPASIENCNSSCWHCPRCGAVLDIQWRDELTPEQVRAMVEAALEPMKERIAAVVAEAAALAAEEREMSARLAAVRLEQMPVKGRWVM